MEIKNLRIKDGNSERICKDLRLIENFGIEGDKKACGGDRQVCLADEKAFSEYKTNGEGLCVERFMPNITTSGLDYETLLPGTVLSLGTAKIEITSTFKKCFPECAFVQSGKSCKIKKNCAFAKVIASGTVKMNDVF